MRLDLSIAAAADIESIATYTIENWAPEQEGEYLGGIWDLLEKIASRPDDHRARPELGKECRSAKYRRHVIFFVVEADRIEVLRVLHGAMDFHHHLGDELA